MNLSKVKVRFIEKHFEKLNELVESAVSRALILMSREEDLSKVNGTIKIIGELFSKMPGVDGDRAGEKDFNTVNLIQQSIVMMNQMKNRE